jgi:hypothetical protein
MSTTRLGAMALLVGLLAGCAVIGPDEHTAIDAQIHDELLDCPGVEDARVGDAKSGLAYHMWANVTLDDDELTAGELLDVLTVFDDNSNPAIVYLSITFYPTGTDPIPGNSGHDLVDVNPALTALTGTPQDDFYVAMSDVDLHDLVVAHSS